MTDESSEAWRCGCSGVSRVLLMPRNHPDWMNAWHEWRAHMEEETRSQWENCWRIAHGGAPMTDAEWAALTDNGTKYTCWICGGPIDNGGENGRWQHSDDTDCTWGRPVSETYANA